jgi:Fic family protein
MYIPKYSITTAILKDIGAVEASREVIENAPLVPTWEAKFQDEAKLRAAHYGTMLEGNDLTFSEAKIIVEGEIDSTKQAADAGVVARDRDIQEVINYRRLLDYIESLSAGGHPENFTYTPDLLFNLHKLVVDKLIDPTQAGAYRTSQVVLRYSVTGEIGFRPPQALEVPFLIDEFFRWLSGDFGRREHPVIRAAKT